MIAHALEVLETRPAYRALLNENYLATDLIPAAAAGRLWVREGAFGTWYTPDNPMTDPPVYRDWFQNGPHVYIIDVVVAPGYSAFRAGRALVRHIRARRAGPIRYWRLHSDRWGVIACPAYSNLKRELRQR